MKRLVTLFCIVSLSMSYHSESFAGQRTKTLNRNSSTKQQKTDLTMTQTETDKATIRKSSRKRNRKKKRVQESTQQTASRHPFKRRKQKLNLTESTEVVDTTYGDEVSTQNPQEDWKNVVPMESNKDTNNPSQNREITLVADKNINNVFTKGLTVSPILSTTENVTPRATQVKRNYKMSGTEATRLRQELNMYRRLLLNAGKAEETV